VARNGIFRPHGHTLLNNMVIAGEVRSALTVYNYMPEQAKKKGARSTGSRSSPRGRSNAIGVAARRIRTRSSSSTIHARREGSNTCKMDYVPSTGRFPLDEGVKILQTDAIALERATAGSSANQSIGAPFFLRLLGINCIRERERHFAGVTMLLSSVCPVRAEMPFRPRDRGKTGALFAAAHHVDTEANQSWFFASMPSFAFHWGERSLYVSQVFLPMSWVL